MTNKKTQSYIDTREPIVAVVGHIDHGKSSLLDYIRTSNSVAGEVGGITQHISAYEAKIKGEDGTNHTITFLDTPGHEAFSTMRERGAQIADIAILIVSAEDGVKAQTIEAWKTIEKTKVHPIVAINKIDKPGADIEKTKSGLVEAGIYVEGFGGDIPCVPISAKTGEGIPELLQTILLVAELAELKGDTGEPGVGTVLESFLDSKRGISATLVLQDGYIGSGMFVLAGGALAPTRIMEDFTGKAIKIAECPSAIKIVGFDEIPLAGTLFTVYSDKKSAEDAQKEYHQNKVELTKHIERTPDDVELLPLIIKADVLGRLDAIRQELEKIDQKGVQIKIIGAGSGNITEADVLMASSDPRTMVLGLGVKIENKSREQIERFKIHVELFDIIYKLTERVTEVVSDRVPKTLVEEVTGAVKIIRCFSAQKEKQVIGGHVHTGKLILGSTVKIIRRDFEIGRGKLIELQSQKIKTTEVNEGVDCGMMIESKFEIAPGDILECVKMTSK
ncbi:MAG: translation initiation factor translation initiation factor [Candidatus Parcubacteria bacterium]|jgi:translation initiation factor IF-2